MVLMRRHGVTAIGTSVRGCVFRCVYSVHNAEFQARAMALGPVSSLSPEEHDAILRFMDAYREAVDWMYSDPKAVEMYAAKIHKPVALLKESMEKFQPKEALQTTEFKDLQGAVRDAVKLKYLDQPLTDAQLKELIVTPPMRK